MKRLFKGKKVSLPEVSLTEASPRELDAIKKELGDVLVQIGNAQYQIELFKADVERFSARAKELNQEGGKRLELDKAKTATSENLNVKS